MKKYIVIFICCLLLFGASAVSADMQSDSKSDATSYVNYNPVTTYEASVFTRHHVGNQSYTHHMETIHPPGAEGWRLYFNPNLAKSFLYYNWNDTKPKGRAEENWLFINPTNNMAPIWLDKEPSGPNVVFMGDVTFRGRDRASSKTAIFHALHHARHSGNAIYYTVKVKSTHKGVGRGLSTGSGATIGKAIAGGPQVDDAMVTFGLGGMLGTTSAWTESVPDAMISVYSSPGEKMPEWYEDIINPKPIETKKTKIFPFAENEAFLVKPVFFDLDKFHIRPQEEEKLFDIGSWIPNNKDFLFSNNLKIYFVGWCDVRGTEEYNNTLGMERAKASMAETRKVCAYHGMSAEEMNKLFVAVSGSEQNKDNSDLFFSEHAMNRRMDVIISSDLTSIPKPNIGDKK